MVYSWNDTITNFFTEKGITAKWHPENKDTNTYLFATNIRYTDKQGQDTFFKPMDVLNKELYSPFVGHFNFCNHIQLMYYTDAKGSTYLYSRPDII